MSEAHAFASRTIEVLFRQNWTLGRDLKTSENMSNIATPKNGNGNNVPRLSKMYSKVSNCTYRFDSIRLLILHHLHSLESTRHERTKITSLRVFWNVNSELHSFWFELNLSVHSPIAWHRSETALLSKYLRRDNFAFRPNANAETFVRLGHARHYLSNRAVDATKREMMKIAFCLMFSFGEFLRKCEFNIFQSSLYAFSTAIEKEILYSNYSCLNKFTDRFFQNEKDATLETQWYK